MLSTLVLGKKVDFPFRHRVLNGILFLGLLLALVRAIVNSFIPIPEETIVLNIFSVVSLILLYYLSRVVHHFKFPLMAAFVLYFIVFSAIWLFSGGSLSRAPYYTMVFVPIVSILLKKKMRLFTIGAFLSATLLLLYWEYLNPTMLQAALSSSNRYLDLGLTLTICVTVSAVITSTVFDSYKRKFFQARLFRRTSRKARHDYHYLCSHDKLTCTLNRTRYEEDLLRLENGPEQQIGVFFFDVDGLKFVNDTLGIESGDRLLLQATHTLHSFFSKNCPIYRIGGDEFVVFLANTNEQAMEKLYGKISVYFYKLQQQEIKNDIPLQLSYAYAIGSSQSIRSLLNNAEGKMIRRKLLHHSGENRTIMQTVKQMLRARDFGTGEHSERMESLVCRFAQRVGFAPSSLIDLKLLAKFHDIGKVGIPDQILLKPGKLTLEEWAVMKSHSEIGCRIANASADLLPIANLILKHHEWWNGQGYPLGLARESIPIECRLLAIADGYDAMINDRPYRKGLSSQEALDELRRCAGIQYDPFLTNIFVGMIENSERVNFYASAAD